MKYTKGKTEQNKSKEKKIPRERRGTRAASSDLFPAHYRDELLLLISQLVCNQKEEEAGYTIIYFLSCTVPLLELLFFSLKFGDLLLLAMSMLFLCLPH
jgi:hypothetical protein